MSDVVLISWFRLMGEAVTIAKREEDNWRAGYKKTVAAIEAKAGYPVPSILATHHFVAGFVLNVAVAGFKLPGLKSYRNERGDIAWKPFGSSKAAKEWRELLEENPLPHRRGDGPRELAHHCFGLDDTTFFVQGSNLKRYVVDMEVVVLGDEVYASLPESVVKGTPVDAELVPEWQVLKAQDDSGPARIAKRYTDVLALAEKAATDDTDLRALARRVIEDMPWVVKTHLDAWFDIRDGLVPADRAAMLFILGEGVAHAKTLTSDELAAKRKAAYAEVEAVTRRHIWRNK